MLSHFLCCTKYPVVSLLCPVFGEKWTYSNGHLFFLFHFFFFFFFTFSHLLKLLYLANRSANFHEIWQGLSLGLGKCHRGNKFCLGPKGRLPSDGCLKNC